MNPAGRMPGKPGNDVIPLGLLCLCKSYDRIFYPPTSGHPDTSYRGMLDCWVIMYNIGHAARPGSTETSFSSILLPASFRYPRHGEAATSSVCS